MSIQVWAKSYHHKFSDGTFLNGWYTIHKEGDLCVFTKDDGQTVAVPLNILFHDVIFNNPNDIQGILNSRTGGKRKLRKTAKKHVVVAATADIPEGIKI